MAILFDHLVRGRKQSRRNLNTKLFCGPEINEQVKFGWLLEREFGGVGAVENLLVGRGGWLDILCAANYAADGFTLTRFRDCWEASISEP
jgi:hypothetical protein